MRLIHIFKAIYRILQYDLRGEAIDDVLSFAAAGVGFVEVARGGNGGKSFVGHCHGNAREGGKTAGKIAASVCARALAAVHVAGKSDNGGNASALGGDAGDLGGGLVDASDLDVTDPRREEARGIGYGKPCADLAEVNGNESALCIF